MGRKKIIKEIEETKVVAEIASVEVEKVETKELEPVAKLEDLVAVETPQVYWDLTDPYHKYTYDTYIRGNK